jgi:hypothetical protein
MLSAIAMAALIYHLIDRVSVYRWVLLGGFSLWLALSGGVFIKAMWSQRSWRSARQDAVARSFNGLLWLDISVPAHWEIRPGQYVQLWLPSSKMPFFLQLPLFYVAYWENTDFDESNMGGRDANEEVHAVRTLHLVTRPRPGLTARIAQDTLNSGQSTINFPVHVLGPFGRPDRFDEYGTVLFVVEDIGLFRTLSYIRQLVLGSRERKNKIRKLEVLWQVDQDERSNLGKNVYRFFGKPMCVFTNLATTADQDWVCDRIQHILTLDHRDRGGFDVWLRSQALLISMLTIVQILNFRIFCLGPRPSDTSLYPNSTRIQYYFEPIRPREELTRYMEHQCGKMVVTGRCIPKRTPPPFLISVCACAVIIL